MNIFRPNLVGGDSHPVLRLEREERHSMMMAGRSLSASIGDCVEATRRFSIEHILAADAELERRGVCTLSITVTVFAALEINRVGFQICDRFRALLTSEAWSIE
jgi:hypothetical protein